MLEYVHRDECTVTSTMLSYGWQFNGTEKPIPRLLTAEVRCESQESIIYGYSAMCPSPVGGWTPFWGLSDCHHGYLI